jgi:hypothetical protein
MSNPIQLYCPNCKEIRSCKRMVYEMEKNYFGDFRGDYRNNVHNLTYPDIHMFRRARQCETCIHEFGTVEVDSVLIDELVKLRDENTRMKNSISCALIQLSPYDNKH